MEETKFYWLYTKIIYWVKILIPRVFALSLILLIVPPIGIPSNLEHNAIGLCANDTSLVVETMVRI